MKFAIVIPLILLAGCALFTGGCAGALSGGSSYRVEWAQPDGTMVRATADSAEKSQDVSFSLAHDAAGKPVVLFAKKSESGIANPALASMAEGLRTAVETMAPLAAAAK